MKLLRLILQFISTIFTLIGLLAFGLWFWIADWVWEEREMDL